MSHGPIKTDNLTFSPPILRRVCHITTVHPRNDTRILLKECKSLLDAGYDVHLVVGDGWGDEDLEGIQIHDIGAKPGSRVKRMWMQPKRALKTVLTLRPDIVHIHDPELLTVGVKLAKKRFSVIYDAHEDFQKQNLNRDWIPKIMRHVVAIIFKKYEDYAVKKIAGVVVATPQIERRFSIQGLKTVNINNYPIQAELAPASSTFSCQKRICYVGGISRMRGILQIIRALPFVSDVRLSLCGIISEPDFESELRAEPGWGQVDYLGNVGREMVRRVMGESSAGLVTLLPAPNYIDSQPIKLFEYMSASIPVIASDFPLWSKIINNAKCGLLVNPLDSRAIAEAMRWIIAHPKKSAKMGESGRNAIKEKYNWEGESKKMLEFYDSLLKTHA